MPSKFHVYVQTYKGNEICDLLKATFYSLDDALAYRDWICSGNPMLVAYLRVDPGPEEESVLERAKRAYGLAESDEERKRRQRREIMRRYRAKKKAQKEASGSGGATTLHGPPEIQPQEPVSVRQTGCVSVCAGKDGKPVVFLGGEE